MVFLVSAHLGGEAGLEQGGAAPLSGRALSLLSLEESCVSVTRTRQSWSSVKKSTQRLATWPSASRLQWPLVHQAAQHRQDWGHEAASNTFSPPPDTRLHQHSDLEKISSCTCPEQHSFEKEQESPVCLTLHTGVGWGHTESQTCALPDPCKCDTLKSMFPALTELAQPAPRTQLRCWSQSRPQAPAAPHPACSANLSAHPPALPQPALPFQQWLRSLLNCGSLVTKTQMWAGQW